MGSRWQTIPGNGSTSSSSSADWRRDAAGHPIANVGIWGMTFGNGAGGTRTNTLYFAAGINGEKDGLFASISLANPGNADGDGKQGRSPASHAEKGPAAVPTRGDANPADASRALDA